MVPLTTLLLFTAYNTGLFFLSTALNLLYLHSTIINLKIMTDFVLEYGVALGPFHCSKYKTPILSVISHHPDIHSHCYAGDI